MEAIITVNGKELTEEQSMTMRIALVSFMFVLNDPKTALGLGMKGVEYHQRTSEIMSMIDETVVQ
jgi:hypothetical protein